MKMIWFDVIFYFNTVLDDAIEHRCQALARRPNGTIVLKLSFHLHVEAELLGSILKV